MTLWLGKTIKHLILDNYMGLTMIFQ